MSKISFIYLLFVYHIAEEIDSYFAMNFDG